MTKIDGAQSIYAQGSVSYTNMQTDSLHVGAEKNRNIVIFNNDSITQTDELKLDTVKQAMEFDSTKDPEMLKNAPSPKVIVKGKEYNAFVVVDTKKNWLYVYNKSGNATKIYKVSTGNESNPTYPGIYSVGWVEKYPYDTAPAETLRHRAPALFGDEAISLYVVDEKTGSKKPTGIMIHGCYKDSDVGGNWSGGCVRMKNYHIVEVAYDARRQPGAYIKVQ